MALTVEVVLEGIKEIVVEVAGIDTNIIAMDKKFTDDLDVDSLSMVEVVVAAEEKFGVKIPDDEVTKMATVGDAVNFIVANGK
jgi:acyl carrier protein